MDPPLPRVRDHPPIRAPTYTRFATQSNYRQGISADSSRANKCGRLHGCLGVKSPRYRSNTRVVLRGGAAC